jgi:hypothetical protein
MKISRLFFGLFALLFFAAASRADETFAQRRQMYLDAVWSDYQAQRGKPSARNAFFRAGALFELGKVEEARKLVHRGLDHLEPGNKEDRWIYGGNSGFIAWPGMDCYVLYENQLGDELKARYRKIYCGAVFYRRLSTSNHKIMAAVTRYLATQVWGADSFQPDPFYQEKDRGGALFDKADPTGEKYVRLMIEEAVKGGPGEYASRPYGAANVLPLLTIAECARDEELRRRALLAYETCLLQLAPAWLRGHLATFAPRSYPDAETQRPWGGAALLWIYFGGVAPDRLAEQTALKTATSKYRLPDAALPIGTDRTQPYIHRALINKWALYHFVNQKYILFSRSPKATGGGFMGQSYPCGVMWDEPDAGKGSHLWITAPAADSPDQIGIHTHGVTKYEQELQHRGALLWVFNIPADFRNPYILGNVPGGHRAVIKEGSRLFLHYGSVLIAISAAAPFEWNAQSGIKTPATPPRTGDSEYRIASLQTAVALETALPAEFPGATPQAQLEAFRNAIAAKTQISFEKNILPTARYTDRAGNKLECEFDGTDKINGAPVDYKNWPVLENPWVNQSGATLTLTGNGTRRVYDFTKWTVTETRP